MLFYLKVLIQVVSISLLLLSIFYLRSKSSKRHNEIQIANWFEEMDVISHHQRWRGERSKIINIMDVTKVFSGVDVRLLCVSRSGRWFFLFIESRWCNVSKWRVDPVDPQDASLELDVPLQVMIDSWRSLVWEKRNPEKQH